MKEVLTVSLSRGINEDLSFPSKNATTVHLLHIVYHFFAFFLKATMTCCLIRDSMMIMRYMVLAPVGSIHAMIINYDDKTLGNSTLYIYSYHFFSVWRNSEQKVREKSISIIISRKIPLWSDASFSSQIHWVMINEVFYSNTK